MPSGPGRPIAPAVGENFMAELSDSAARKIRKALGLPADATELEMLARIREIEEDGYKLVHDSELRSLRRQAERGEEMVGELLFDIRFDHARGQGRVLEQERSAWAGAYESDPDGVLEALHHQWGATT
jgi:hypothetical protein